MQWLSSTPDAPSDPVIALVAANMLTCRTLRLELQPPTKLTDDELRRISAPTTVVMGDLEVIYGGGPEAALARAQTLIPSVHALLLPSDGQILTLDAPDVVVTEMTAR